MRIYVTNIPAKFYPDPFWNDGALGFSTGRPNKDNKNSKDSSWSKNRTHYGYILRPNIVDAGVPYSL